MCVTSVLTGRYSNGVYPVCRCAHTMEFEKDPSLKEWAREQPLTILALDPADRAVLRIAGKSFQQTLYLNFSSNRKYMFKLI